MTTTAKPRTRRTKAAPKAAAAPKTKRPSSAKLITRERYIQDVQQRWAIHQFEVDALFQDISKGYKATSSYVKSSYDRAFN